jgi:hypothetical protein
MPGGAGLCLLPWRTTVLSCLKQVSCQLIWQTFPTCVIFFTRGKADVFPWTALLAFFVGSRTEESSPPSQSDRGPKDAFGMLRWGKLGMRDTHPPQVRSGQSPAAALKSSRLAREKTQRFLKSFNQRFPRSFSLIKSAPFGACSPCRLTAADRSREDSAACAALAL